jgi:serine/threonine-protein kinase
VIGKTFAHYKIVEKIGAGGMGEVYRASDSKLGRDVALKMLAPAFAQDAERMARFQREAQVLASLNHPNIGAIYGFEELDDSRVLVLELIEGPTLSDRLGAGRVPVSETLGIACQIAEAVECAHESGVVHRDLKPANVKVTDDGRVKVLDFGLAKALEDPVVGSGASDPAASPTLSPTLQSPITGALTGVNVILGTAAYMSPEQARGKAIDKRADIWAFGVVLWEMLTGRRLFDGETVSDTLAAVLRKEPEWDALPDKTPMKVKRLLRRCLERDPGHRLRDIGDARITLEEVLAGDLGEPEAVAPAAAGPGWPLLFGAVAAAAVIGAAVGLLVERSMRPATPELPLLKFQIPVPDLLTTLATGGTTVAISPDGRRIAYTTQSKLWVRDLDDLKARELPRTEGGTMPFWSPDGEWIGYGDREKLYKIRAQGGTPLTLCELENDFNPAAGGAWGEDGRIAFTDGSGQLWSVSAQGGDPDTLLALDPEGDQDFHNVSALPGGKGLIFVVHRKDDTYDRIDLLANGQRKPLVFMEGEQLELPTWSPPGYIVFGRSPTNPGIWAVPFSLSSLEVTGEPFLALPDAVLPTVSRNGTMVLALGDFSGSNQLMWVNRQGVPGERVGVAQVQDSYFPLSPNGEQLVVRVRGEDIDLYLVDVVRQTKTRLTFSDASEGWPVWSRDGRQIYYDDTQDFPTSTMWVTNADGSGEPVELGPGATVEVSPDGRYLLYSLYSGEGLDWDLYYVRLDEAGLPDGDPVPFLDTGVITWGPRVSPDGRFVAYHSNDTGQHEIYLKPFPTGSGKWQISVDGGFWPTWKADGTELYYVSGNDILAVPVELDPAVRLGTPERLFTRPDQIGAISFGWPDGFQATPDGERFLIAVRPEGHKEDQDRGLVVVQNWFSEIKGRE